MVDRFLIVGLGNPGRKYDHTRHNIGFRCVDAMAAAHSLSFDRRQSKARVAAGLIEAQPVCLVKPQTFMNLSGNAVRGVATFYKIPPEQIMVVFDDMDLPLGTVRLRKSGGAGGHQGMKHIIQQLGTQDFPRLRFGIGRPPGRMDPAAYVLRPFKDDEEILVVETVDRVVRAVATWLTQDIEIAMTLHNGTAEQAANARRDVAPEMTLETTTEETNNENHH